jgi:hypothetical protein
MRVIPMTKACGIDVLKTARGKVKLLHILLDSVAAVSKKRGDHGLNDPSRLT